VTQAAPPQLEAKPESSFAEVDGIRVHYHDVGSGDPVVLIHGAGPGAFGWGNFFRCAPALSENFRLIIPDLPGFGESGKPADVSDPLKAYAAPTRGLLEHLEIERAHFVGNSMGGGTCLRIALDDPDCVDRLVVMGSVGFEPGFIVPEPTQGVAMITRYYTDPSVESMRELAEALVFDGSIVSDELVRQRFEYATSPANIDAGSALSDSLRRPETRRKMDLASELYQISARTLLMWGRDDRFVPLDSALGLLKRLPDGRLHVISNCGHSVQLEFPEEFAQVVTGFLQQP
jgi:4,5:9,10-diseco-3-hydroxy-5,9,17-trioxoandrosta-1(10),2-diene-4-oate hydrolase